METDGRREAAVARKMQSVPMSKTMEHVGYINITRTRFRGYEADTRTEYRCRED